MAQDVPDWTQAVVTASEAAVGPSAPALLPGHASVVGVDGAADFSGQPFVGSLILRVLIEIFDPGAPTVAATCFASVADALGNTIAVFYIPGIADEYTVLQQVTELGPVGYPIASASQLPVNLSINNASATSKAYASLVFTAVPSNPYG